MLGDIGPDMDEDSLTLAMNGFHGAGTALIATFNLLDAELRQELAVASEVCGQRTEDKGSARMILARACLSKAIDLRSRLRQTSNQISGTAENIGFTYLRDGDFDGAFANSLAVERTGLFAWNELIRTLAASHLRSPSSNRAQSEARKNISFFETGRFNPCELQTLLGPDLFAEAQAIVLTAHGGELRMSCRSP